MKAVTPPFTILSATLTEFTVRLCFQIQSMVRMHQARKKYRDRLKYFKDHVSPRIRRRTSHKLIIRSSTVNVLKPQFVLRNQQDKSWVRNVCVL